VLLNGADLHGSSGSGADPLPPGVPSSLPADRPRPPRQASGRAAERLAAPAGTAAAVAALSAGLGVTPFSVLLAALFAVLHRHTGESSLLVGAPAAGRGGLLVLPAELAADTPFASLASQVHRTVTAAHDQRDVTATPGQKPAQAPDAARVPLVQLLIDYLPGGTPAVQRTAEFDLELTVEETGASMRYLLCYDSGVYDRATAARLLGHYADLLAGAVRDPAMPIGAIQVRLDPGPAPAWELPVPAGYTPPDPAGDGESLAGRFRRTAAAHGGRLALTGPSASYTYRELDQITDTFAAVLRPALGEGGRVALLCGHDVGAVIGVWSVLKAGGTYVPLDPQHPDGRLSKILADAAVDVIVCDPGLVRRSSALTRGRPVIPVPAGQPVPGSPAQLPVTADTPAYLLHTSGSTALPKGVMQTHRNVLRHALKYAARMRIGPDDRLSLLARVTFDAAVMDLFGALLTGASLHLVDPAALGPAELRQALGTAAPSVLHCTPTLLRALFAGADGPDGVTFHLGSARAVVLGGEEVTRADVQAFHRHFRADCSLVNGLGPTECTVALQYLVRPADAGRSSIPVGYPVEDVQVDLVDATGRPTEVFGEIVIRSDQVARGYWNAPERTAAAFGHGPDGKPFYRTGDLARRLPGGALVFCGRKDQVVKIRGHRVEPAEAETLLRGHPTVAQAAVIIDQRAGRRARLVGYVTSATPVPADPDELADYLRRQLPEHAVPAQLAVIDEIPVGPTGKLDRVRLPAPPEGDLDAAGPAPHTPAEVTVARIWCEILRRERVGLRLSFLATGADSLQIMELLARLENEFGIRIPLQDFLRAPTVESLARLTASSARR
jgi:amino acid adenylation domain-containing protein